MHSALIPLFILLFSHSSTSFYLPGVAPTNFKKNDPVELHVNALSSSKTFVPYDFYYEQFHFCRAKDGSKPVSQAESLGSILWGDRIFGSTVDIKMLENSSCKLWCKETIPAQDATFINKRIKENYTVNWLVDGLPAARKRQDNRTKEIFYSMGFELGDVNPDGSPVVHNHYDIQIEYHTEDPPNAENPSYRVVGVLVWPYSKKTVLDDKNAAKCNTEEKMVLKDNGDNEVVWTYSVNWVQSDVPWATRWDKYLHVFDPKIHWFSIINAIVIVLFLTGMVAMILLRALHKDINRYNLVEAQEDAQEDFGWKLVHGDVFRPPVKAMLLSVYLGNGAQLFLMTAVTLVFAVLGFLSPSNRGSLMTVLLVFWVCFASAAGFVSARVYKMFGGENWKKNVMLTAFLLPGALFLGLITLNFFLIGEKSSGAVPFGTLFALVALWFLVSAPLSFVGSYYGFKKPKIEHPVRTNQIPRQIPEQVWYLRPIPVMLMGGVLPFGAIFIELFFIMKSIWYHQVYYVFGFLMLVFSILVLTCSEVTILMCYFQLCAEDYDWWWRSFLTAGSSALYMFLYTVLYYFTQLQVHSFVSTILYFGWSAIMSSMFFVLTGTIGFFACFLFVRKIYGSIKID
ncbi:hypothetical protein BKA69DRAFT_1124062 [Paraphysoderma sedebokerense]|nr:hypothetical protein BKA69DRAFT_1124062 [Paraphysoderma sedebokerense]